MVPNPNLMQHRILRPLANSAKTEILLTFFAVPDMADIYNLNWNLKTAVDRRNDGD
jgi:hypothetical protein